MGDSHFMSTVESLKLYVLHDGVDETSDLECHWLEWQAIWSMSRIGAINTYLLKSTSVIVSGGSDNDIVGRMCRMPDGRLLAIVERNSDWNSGNFFATFSSDEGDTWSPLDTVIFQSGNQSTHSVFVVNDTIYLCRLYF